MADQPAPLTLCATDDLVAGAGVAARHGTTQIALFYLPGEDIELFAVGNHDPIGGANVISRGVIGDINGEIVVASPLYKQHFSLRTGQCLEDASYHLPTYRVAIAQGRVLYWP